jgi:hypothetical protein
MWLDRVQAEALGFLNLKQKQMELLKPLKAEVKLSSLTLSSKCCLGDLQNQISKSIHFMRLIGQIGFEKNIFRSTTTFIEVLTYIDLSIVYFTVWELK